MAVDFNSFQFLVILALHYMAKSLALTIYSDYLHTVLPRDVQGSGKFLRKRYKGTASASTLAINIER